MGHGPSLWIFSSFRHKNITLLPNRLIYGRHTINRTSEKPKTDKIHRPNIENPMPSVREEQDEALLSPCNFKRRVAASSTTLVCIKGRVAGNRFVYSSSHYGLSRWTWKVFIVGIRKAIIDLLTAKREENHEGNSAAITTQDFSFMDLFSFPIWVACRKLPFQEKHIMQQASILGNLELFGVLKSSLGREPSECEEEPDQEDDGVPAVIEFGAGRGYLTQMLADCYGIKRVFLVERKSYKLKADRSLRQNEGLMLERLRIDIEDLDLSAVESLEGVPFLAIGKHLCGAATDLALRCCFPENNERYNAKNFGGLAIATCCHHLCQWKHYTNKKYFLDLGMTKDEFHAITWFTSWAVDANHGSDLPDKTDCISHLQSIDKEKGDEYVSGVEKILTDMKPAERASLGFKCKRIIDMGRLTWLRRLGLNTQLVRYVPSSISPENYLLIAKHANRM
ncbi:tRNA:m(4)X modification enzyme TRM13-like protein isoform X1 [Senna tora]|uniref:tRNA:m(4)X modification enzyme TRM13 n=1 Tax=Senna tora TaxID=362788 RepID=A0A834SPY4_9FABA|nr:tRNA:m(4)X modification enzyme TRM13-like protein isoform X1 [Senna tora]